MKTKYFIDFDDVLFDRAKFWTALVDIMQSEGIEEDFKATYRDPEVYKNGGYAGVWNHLEHINAINSQRTRPKTYNYKRLKDKLTTFLADLREFVFPDAPAFVRSINRENYEVFLLTVGNPQFQELKVKNSGVIELFGVDHIIYTESAKEVELERLVGLDEPFCLIEDKSDTVAAVRKGFPNAEVTLTANGDLLPFIDPFAASAKKEHLAAKRPA